MQATYLALPVAHGWFCFVLCNLHGRDLRSDIQRCERGCGAFILLIYHHIIGTNALVSLYLLLGFTKL